jgi:hypothetical protein
VTQFIHRGGYTHIVTVERKFPWIIIHNGSGGNPE